VTIVVPAFNDQIAADIGARLTGTTSTLLTRTGVDLAIFGAHLRGQPLHWRLEQLGARFVDQISTADACPGELFRISEAGLGRFLAALPAPMALTNIELDDGRTVIGLTATDVT
jgi:allophanate hydrolase